MIITSEEINLFTSYTLTDLNRYLRFWCQKFFQDILSSKMNLRILAMRYAADPDIWFPTKSILHQFRLLVHSDSAGVKVEEVVE